MSGNQIGVIFLCPECLRGLENRVGKINTEKELTLDAFCMWCGEQKELRRVPALLADLYDPRDTRTTNCPEGDPWYITGYLPEKEKPK